MVPWSPPPVFPLLGKLLLSGGVTYDLLCPADCGLAAGMHVIMCARLVPYAWETHLTKGLPLAAALRGHALTWGKPKVGKVLQVTSWSQQQHPDNSQQETQPSILQP